MFHHAKDESADFLPSLTQSFKSIDVSQPIPTQQFVDACSKVQPIFDHIGRWLVDRSHSALSLLLVDWSIIRMLHEDCESHSVSVV